MGANNKARRPRRRLQAPQSDADAIRARFSHGFAILLLDPGNFHRELPTRDERALFARVFPAEFGDMWGFHSHATDKYPASCSYGEPFRRPAEFYADIDLGGFDPPVPTSRIGSLADREKVAEARGAWWKTRRLAMTPEEKAWLAGVRPQRQQKFSRAEMDDVVAAFIEERHDQKDNEQENP